MDAMLSIRNAYKEGRFLEALRFIFEGTAQTSRTLDQLTGEGVQLGHLVFNACKEAVRNLEGGTLEDIVCESEPDSVGDYARRDRPIGRIPHVLTFRQGERGREIRYREALIHAHLQAALSIGWHTENAAEDVHWPSTSFVDEAMKRLGPTNNTVVSRCFLRHLIRSLRGLPARSSRRGSEEPGRPGRDVSTGSPHAGTSGGLDLHTRRYDEKTVYAPFALVNRERGGLVASFVFERVDGTGDAFFGWRDAFRPMHDGFELAVTEVPQHVKAHLNNTEYPFDVRVSIEGLDGPGDLDLPLVGRSATGAATWGLYFAYSELVPDPGILVAAELSKSGDGVVGLNDRSGLQKKTEAIADEWRRRQASSSSNDRQYLAIDTIVVASAQDAQIVRSALRDADIQVNDISDCS